MTQIASLFKKSKEEIPAKKKNTPQKDDSTRKKIPFQIPGKCHSFYRDYLDCTYSFKNEPGYSFNCMQYITVLSKCINDEYRKDYKNKN